MAQTTVCSSCGSKFAAARDRCPRCHVVVVRVDAAAERARSKRMARAAAVILGTSVLALGVFYLTRESTADRPVATAPKDPLAARRQAGAARPEPEPARNSAAQNPFLEPAGRASLAYDAGDFPTALARFEEAVRKNPSDAESLSNLGQVLVKLGRAAEALPHFERACALNPERWTYRFNLARAFSVLGRWDESIASYRQAQGLFPDDYVTTFNLALALHKKGDDAAAVGEYKKAVALNPEEPSFRMALAISYESLQNRPEAAAAYSEYLRLSPAAPDADKVKARIALLTGQPVPAPTPGF